MPDELGTRDVLEQLDARLESIEQSLRSHASHTDGRFERIDDRFDVLRGEIASHSRWLLGVVLGSWITLVASFWLKP